MLNGLHQKANLSDDVGLIEMFKQNLDYFRDKPLACGKTTILLDNGYHPQRIREELEKVYPEIMDKIQFELSPKPSKSVRPLSSVRLLARVRRYQGS